MPASTILSVTSISSAPMTRTHQGGLPRKYLTICIGESAPVHDCAGLSGDRIPLLCLFSQVYYRRSLERLPHRRVPQSCAPHLCWLKFLLSFADKVKQ
jgi:hypothetical protein